MTKLFVLFLINSITIALNKHCQNSSCFDCIAGYSYRNTSCLANCPSGYKPIGSKCAETKSTTLFELEFFNLFNHSIPHFSFFSSSSIPAQSRPKPTRSQGLFFTANSEMTASRPWVLGPDLCLTYFIRVLKPGKIFTVSSSTLPVLELSFMTSFLTLNFLLMNSSGTVKQSSQVEVKESWTSAYFSINQFQSYATIKTPYLTKTYENLEFRLNENNLKFVLGSGELGFQGYLFYLCLQNSINCYSKSFNLPIQLYNPLEDQYGDERFAEPDGSFASKHEEAREIDSCYSSYCSKCAGFNADSCEVCSDPALAACIPAKDCEVGSGFNCSLCKAGFQLFQGLCLKPHSAFLPLKLILDKPQELFLGVFKNGEVQATYAPYNRPDADDPFPLLQRGFLFEPGQLIQSDSLILPAKFTVSSWVFDLHISKLVQSRQLSVSSDGLASISLSNLEETRVFTVNSNCASQGWKYLKLVVDYFNGTTHISTFCGKQAQRKLAVHGFAFYAVDQKLAVKADQMFYLYSLEILNFADKANRFGLAACFRENEENCLINKTLDWYLEADATTWKRCDKSCRFGCRRPGSCNLCRSLNCERCSGYNGECSKYGESYCLPGLKSTHSGSRCCYEDCEDCFGAGMFECLRCRAGLYLVNSMCVESCPSFYSLRESSCIGPDDGIIAEFNLETLNRSLASRSMKLFYPSVFFNNSEIHLKNNPVPAKGRGMYFSRFNYLISSNLSLPYLFSISIWTKIERHGVLLIKDKLMLNTSGSFKISKSGLSFPALPLNAWTLLTVNLNQSAPDLILTLSTEHGVTIQTLVPKVFVDKADELFLAYKYRGFNGFIYSFTILTAFIPQTLLSTCTYPFTPNSPTNPADPINSTYSADSIHSTHSTCLWPCNISSYFNGSHCEPCKPSCTKGCAHSKTCSLCNHPSCSNCSDFYSNCSCKAGYYFSALGCAFCEYPCGECEGPSACLTCFGNYEMAEGRKCVCKAGYYFGNDECWVCDQTCKSCEGPGSCTSCVNNLRMGEEGKCGCLKGFYLEGGWCRLCAKAQGMRTGGVLGCHCKEGTLVNSSCVQCHKSCSECRGAGERDCIRCRDGLLMDSLGLCGGLEEEFVLAGRIKFCNDPRHYFIRSFEGRCISPQLISYFFYSPFIVRQFFKPANETGLKFFWNIGEMNKVKRILSRRVSYSDSRCFGNVLLAKYLLGYQVQGGQEADSKRVQLLTPSRSDFDLKFMLGRGGFGTVWKVEHKATRQVLAFKEMSKARLVNLRNVNSLMEEREILGVIKGKFIVQLHYTFQDYENLYLVFDYKPAGDMKYYQIKKFVFSEEQVKFFAACVCVALKSIHSQKVIHRDIKPENLLFDEKGFLYVTDFGFAKWAKQVNYFDTSGTIAYMAPEVVSGKNHGYVADYFSLGVVIYEIFESKRPFLSENRTAYKQEVYSGKDLFANLTRNWSNEMIDFVKGLLSAKPEKRLGFKGFNEVIRHPWMKSFNWKKLSDMKVEPPFKPNIIKKTHPGNVIIWNADGNSEGVQLEQIQDLFVGFSSDGEDMS